MKRIAIGANVSLSDPAGLAVPVQTKLQLLMEETHKQMSNMDTPLSEDSYKGWRKLIKSIADLRGFRIHQVVADWDEQNPNFLPGINGSSNRSSITEISIGFYSSEAKTNRYVEWQSSITLYWVQSDPLTYSTYLCNCMFKVQQDAANSEWQFCPGTNNPVDVLSQGCYANDPVNNK